MKGLIDGESLLVVDSYATTDSNKTKGTTGLLLSSGESKSLDLTVMDSINTPITTKTKATNCLRACLMVLELRFQSASRTGWSNR